MRNITDTMKYEMMQDLNKEFPKLIRWEDDGTFPSFIVLRAKNYVMKDESGKIFKIYSENKEKVKLLIYVDADDKVHGRALVWKVKKSPCESKYFMDRIYTNRDSDVNRFKDFANNEGWFYKKKMNSHVDDNVLFVYKGEDVAGEVKLKLEGNFRSYPFIDTMCFLSKDKDSLSNLSDKKCYHLHDVYGDREKCEDCDGDVILLKIDQIGGIACHTGRASCFYRRFEQSADPQASKWVTVDPVLKDPELIYK
jgi:hypothetical protein